MKKIEIYALGGLGRIGMNMLLLQVDDDALIIDAGVMFPDEYYPGIDLILPPFLPRLKASGLKIHGILATHGHEDHIGAIPFVQKHRNTPVYGSKFTLGLLDRKYKEHQLDEKHRLVEVKAEEHIDLGPFKVEFIEVSHSIVDAFALSIDTPAGRVLHTGDFKIDDSPYGNNTNLKRFAQLGNEGVHVMLSDSTNVEVPGHSKSESSVKDGLEDLLKQSQGFFVVASFASHIPRLQQVFDLSAQYGRKVTTIGRSMVQNVKLANDLGYLDIDESILIDSEKAGTYPRDQVTILSTGTQGEPRAALAKLALDEHRDFLLEKGDDVVMSSRFIPGNEKAIFEMMNELHRTGATVHTNQGSDIHVSGHAYKEDLRHVIDLIKPKFFVPIHGEYRHLLKHADLAHEQGIEKVLRLENNYKCVIGPKSGHVEAIDALEPIVVMQKQISQMGDVLCKARRKMSYSGVIVLSILIDKKNHAWKSDLDVQTPGVFLPELEEQWQNKLKQHIEAQYFQRMRKQQGFNPTIAIESLCKKFMRINFRRSPEILTQIVYV